MATTQFEAPRNFYDLASYLSFGSQFQEALRTAGLVQTGDSGQINFVAYSPTITGTELTSNVAKYYVNSTAGLRVNLTMTVSGVVNNAAVFNISGAITSVGANYFTLAKTNANIAYTADVGTAVASIETTYPAYNTSRYQIWRFNDSLQATAPVYFRIYYGNVHNTYNNTPVGPYFNIQIGTGSNGSGTILNPYVTGVTTLSFSSGTCNNCTATGTNCTSLVSADTNRLQMLLWRNAAFPAFFSIERTKDSSGNDTSYGVAFAWMWTGQEVSSAITYHLGFDMMLQSGAHYTEGSNIPCLQFSGSSTLLSAGIGLFPLFIPWSGTQNPLLGCMAAKASDFGEGDTFTYSMYPNKSITYIVSKYTNTAQTQQRFGYGTNNAIVMRWD